MEQRLEKTTSLILTKSNSAKEKCGHTKRKPGSVREMVWRGLLCSQGCQFFIGFMLHDMPGFKKISY